jgi:Rrf2 family nitric oxide-sensitive transcriptional repressor
MQLTHFTDYALRVLIFVAGKPDRRLTIREVSVAHGISEHHLTKVVHRLAKLGYLKSVRGRGGGIEAALPPAQITVGGVIRDLEPLTPVECFAPGYTGQCILHPGCALRGALQLAQSRFLATLDACTIADLVPRASARSGARAVRPGARARARAG